jgi:hypothetical protein
MPQDPNLTSSLFTHIDVSSHASHHRSASVSASEAEVLGLLRELVRGQQRQNELLEELVQQMGASQRQRANELGQWRQANPQLAKRCRQAAEALSSVQTEFLRSLTEEITESAEDFMQGDFLLNEFVDRFGPRLAHLNGVLQVLSQLSSVPAHSGTSE